MVEEKATPGPDTRRKAASYYDLAPHRPNDVPFYLGRLRSSESRVLELGCGTGRVSIPLVKHGARLLGVDHSDAMLDVLRAKVPPDVEARLRLTRADISDFDLGEVFDLVIAPFRVVQNLATDDELSGLLRCIRRHLAPDGRCILNAFRPNRARAEMIAAWPSGEEHLAWTVDVEAGYVSCHDRRVRVQEDPLVLYPEFVYRHVVDGDVVDEAVLRIAMRCFYAEEFVARIEAAGFKVTDRWGGYAGEVYGEGPELVVEFVADGDAHRRG